MFRLILYPGIITHELMHALMCLLFGVKIKTIKFGLKESYVKHDDADALKIFAIALAPLILGNLFAIYLIIISAVVFDRELLPFLILNWLAISIIFYSIPSVPDTKNIIESIIKSINNIWKGTFLDKILASCYFIVIFLPAYALISIIRIIDKIEALRIVMLLSIYILVFTFI